MSGADRISISDLPANTAITIELVDAYGNKYTKTTTTE